MRSILLYHNIGRTFSPFGGVIHPNIFRKHLLFLKKKGGKFINIEEWIYGKDGIVISFDDGFAELYQFLPSIIEDFNVRPLVFLVSDYLCKINSWDLAISKKFRHLNRDEILKLHKMGVVFGSHSHTHPDLRKINDKSLTEELILSKKTLEDLIGEEMAFFSYPFGLYNKKVIEAVRECGYKAGFIASPLPRNETIFNIGRWPVYTIDTLYNLELKIKNKGIISSIEAFKCKSINFISRGTYILNRLSLVKNQS